MSKFHVILDSMNPNFPEDGNPLSLIGVKEIVISNLILDEFLIILHFIGFHSSKDYTYDLRSNIKESSIIITVSEDWTRFFIMTDLIPEDKQSTFDLEFISKN